MRTIILLALVASTYLVSCSSFRSHSGKVVEAGWASWYGDKFQGRKTASGERFNKNEMTAAHRTLPFGTMVSVRSLATGKTVRVRINDRGPFVDGRVIDLSYAAAEQLGIIQKGQEKVEIFMD